ncbi:MAG: MBL fold metallo-hydrolase, partial [Pseudomonadota bacterium]
LLRFAVRPEDEAAAQLRAIGVDPERIGRILLTHGHSDHMGGLYAFPAALVDAPAADFPDGEGVLTCRFDTRPFLSVLRAGERASITRDGALQAIGMPGHSRGHRGALLRTSRRDVLFAGDAAFDIGQIKTGEIGAVATDRPAAARTLDAIRALASARPTVVLPTHDPQALDRLAALTPYA